jgi:hypothetical protein
MLKYSALDRFPWCRGVVYVYSSQTSISRLDFGASRRSIICNTRRSHNDYSTRLRFLGPSLAVSFETPLPSAQAPAPHGLFFSRPAGDSLTDDRDRSSSAGNGRDLFSFCAIFFRFFSIAFFASLPDRLLKRACNLSFFSSPEHIYLSVSMSGCGYTEIRNLSLDAILPFLVLVSAVRPA